MIVALLMVNYITFLLSLASCDKYKLSVYKWDHGTVWESEEFFHVSYIIHPIRIEYSEFKSTSGLSKRHLINKTEKPFSLKDDEKEMTIMEKIVRFLTIA